MKNTFFAFAALAALIVAIPAHAQYGCTNSPENPTLILAGLAGGAYAFQSVRARISARKANKK